MTKKIKKRAAVAAKAAAPTTTANAYAANLARSVMASMTPSPRILRKKASR